MKRPDDPTSPSAGRLLAGLGLRLLAVLAFAWLVDASGLAGAGDAALRDAYYGVRGLRDSSQRVILVSIDAPTVTAWGPPPWRADQLQPVLAAIAKGGAAAVGLADEPARLLAPGVRVPGGVVAGRVTLDLGAGAVEAATLRDEDGPTSAAKLLVAAGLDAPGDRVAINYLGRRGLPMVSAAEVWRGNIPGESFAGKIVVVGLTAQPYAGLVPTPVGPLAPAQVQAHALSSVADGVAWSQLSPLLRWLAIGLLCAAAMIGLRHLATLGAAIATVVIVLALVGADYALFAAAAMRLGATLPVIAVLAAIAAERLYERIAVRRHTTEIALWTRQWIELDSMRSDVPDDEPGYWLRVAGLARLYLGCTSTIVAELPPGKTHLKLRVINGTTAKQIAERRRDIRRSPYRKAHLTLSPVWHDKFMSDGKSTLLVPLVQKNQLRGFWIVSFPSRDAVAAPHLALIKTLAREIAMAIDRRRAASTPEQAPGLLHKLLGAGRFSIDLEEVRRAFAAHTQNQQDLVMLGESMPMGVFVATLWGEIRYMNTAMKLVCKQEGLDPASTSNSLPDMLCRLTGFHANEVNGHLRKLVQELEELHLRGRDRIDRAGRDFVLSWLKPPGGGDPADSEQLIVVCALPPRSERRAALPAQLGATVSMMKPPADEHAVTAPRLKIDPAAAGAGGGVNNATPMQLLAQGTPRFDEVLGSGGARRAQVVPDATLQLSSMAGLPVGLASGSAVGGAAGDVPGAGAGGADAGAADGADAPPGEDIAATEGAVTFVVAGSSARTSRSLPVLTERAIDPNEPAHNRTLPMFKFTIDDSQ